MPLASEQNSEGYGNCYRILGFYWDNGKEKWKLLQYIGVLLGYWKRKMETAIVYWGSIGIMEKKNGNCYRILGFYWDNGKEKWKLLSYIGVLLG